MGRRSALEAAIEGSPWEVRQKAARKMGRIRRVITDRAMDGLLPDEEQRDEYLRAQAAFEGAHTSWLASRAPGA